MTLGDWDGLAPLAAVIALAILALSPNHGPPPGPPPQARQDALEAAPAGESIPWVDTQSGRQGVMIAAGIFRGIDGRWCRRYRVAEGSTTTIDDRVACRGSEGAWQDLPLAPAAPQLAETPP